MSAILSTAEVLEMADAGIAESIRRGLSDCSPAERKVARVLLAAYPSAGFETVARLADRAGVSGPTVLRFVQRLGYRGFPDFQEALRRDLDERSASPLRIHQTRVLAEEPSGSLHSRAAAISTATLQRTFDELSTHDLDRCVELISGASGSVVIAGGRYSGLLGRILALHLEQLRPRVRMLPDEPSARAAMMADLGRRDVLVLFDYRRYEEHTLRLARVARAQHTSVVLFTDAWLSPISSEADVVLTSETAAPSPFDALTPVMALIETVVAGCFDRLGDAAVGRMAQADQLAGELGLY
ncbi:DNA-binding MurR/RpiR family transcriptional regulator [Microbacterium sp. BE35]|uniref:MurR/RpiR family transcriptional regulator n=1 Tax=Microbacterium sp. BE35 TaxID=2817773 RepID=UPI00285CAD40|nr:MurR/RpiR family transcriptional regulator [Microbacterium sp. BE35]MDR7188435.1 DNA-binding MurR/RpiR family transcriptional regulator [Microbacterium sp. BE35]